MDEKLLSIQEAAKKLKVSTKTLRRWEERGILVPQRTDGNHRRYTATQISGFWDKLIEKKKEKKAVAVASIAPVSSASPSSQEIIETPQAPFNITEALVADSEIRAEVARTSKFKMDRAVRMLLLSAVATLAAVFMIVVLTQTFLSSSITSNNSNKTKTAQGQQTFAESVSGKGESVLAATDGQPMFTIKFNIPTFFKEDASFLKNVKIQGLTSAVGGIDTENADINAGTGKLTASNVIYSVTAGAGISVTGGQNPIITNTGVLSIGGQTGAIALTAGSGISISGTTISSTVSAPSVDTFKNIVTGSDTITASGNNDTLNFIAGSGISLSADTGAKSLTISSNIVASTSPWQESGSVVNLVNSGDTVGIGTATTPFKLTVAGSIGPDADQAYDLGSLSDQFNNVYGSTFFSAGSAGITQGTPSCVTVSGGIVTGTGVCQLGSEQWVVSNGSIYTGVTTLDLILGGNSTASAKFAVLNVSGGTPIASLSAQNGSGQGIYLSADGSVQTPASNKLTIGGSTTGDIFLSPRGGAGSISLDSVVINGGAVTAGSWNGNTITTQYGGTGQDFSAIVQGAVPYFNGIGTMAALAPSTAGFILSTNGSGANPTWIDPTGIGPWNSANGTLYPKILTQDVLIGGNSTASAKFGFINVNSGTPTATIAGNITLSGSTPTIGTTNLNTFTLGDASTGDIVIAPAGSAAITALSGGNVGIGTGTPSQKLDVSGGIRLGAASNNNVLNTSAAGGAPTGDLFWGSRTICDTSGNCSGTGAGIGGSGDTNRIAKFTGSFNLADSSISDLYNAVALTIDAKGALGIGQTNPIGQFEVEGAPPGQALSVFSYTGSDQNIITASSSGVTVFNVDASGNIDLTNSGAYKINGASVLSSNTLGGSVVNSVLTSVGNLVSGMISVGFGTITTSNTITGTTLNGTTGINTGVGAGTQRIDASGNLVGIGSTQLNGVTYNWPGSDATLAGYVLSSDAAGHLSWIDVSTANTQIWERKNGLIIPTISTVDFALGGTSTSSARFAVLNMNVGTPTASIAAGTADNATFLTGTGFLQTTNRQTLTLGGGDTGNVNFVVGPSNNLSVNGLAGVTVGSAACVTTSNGIVTGSAACPVGSTDSPFQSIGSVIAENNQTQDFLLGGTSTSSARFAVLNISGGTPTASISGSTPNNALYITGDGTIATTNKQNLTLGSADTGNVSV
ncbi:MAG TPA: helix-turn-helix domain-containing protein, partial [Patescibacteria group bacterium]|nr:helix-turn-helix domain-containing protein [Patescibacteria group bacterium]